MVKDKNLGIVISLIIFVGVLISSIFSYVSYNNVITENTISIAELSAMNIYSDINKELIKPIYVSLTMANDSFVISWLENEDINDSSEITAYLDGIQEQYDYASVFLISSDSLDYYRYTGFHKTITAQDEHDVWYFDFINSESPYELDVDIDEATGLLTIFVNAKLFDADNNLRAVVGVGVEMGYIQDLLSKFEDEYDLEAFLINNDGLVQSHSNSTYIEERNIFEESFYSEYRNEISFESSDNYIIQKGSRIVITKYINELNWNIIVVKETHIISVFFMNFLVVNLINLFIVVIIISTLVNSVVNKNKLKVYELAKTDHLTLLLNRRGFDMELTKLLDNDLSETFVFMVDIDRFKVVNDTKGHVFGDKVLRIVARIIDEKVKPYGKLSRWGGDEFTGVLLLDEVKGLELLEKFRNEIESDKVLASSDITVSIGYTISTFSSDVDSVLTIIDKALYKSKARGGNTITML